MRGNLTLSQKRYVSRCPLKVARAVTFVANAFTIACRAGRQSMKHTIYSCDAVDHAGMDPYNKSGRPAVDR
jgi:hypothetical protein